MNFDNPTNASWAVTYMQAVAKQIGWDNMYLTIPLLLISTLYFTSILPSVPFLLFDCVRYAIEIGNEVDLFGSNGFRSPGYSYNQYKGEFEYYVKSLSFSF